MMNLIRRGTLALLPFLSSAIALKASVNVVGVDSTAGPNWRTGANLDGDQEYGTSGYVIYGLAEADSVYTTNYDISSGNSNNVFSLPDGVGVTSIDTNIAMWSGNGNFGTLEDPTAGNAITSVPVLANSNGTKRFTVTRSNSEAFRLTIITASGDNQGTEYTVTVNDGSGPQSTTYDHPSNGVAYHVFDVSNGNSDITVDIASASQNRSLTGIAFDSASDITDPTDDDNDGMGDNWETFFFGDLSRDGSGDFDSDGLIDADEWVEKTSPADTDSDDDDLTDGQEVNTYSTDPLDDDSDDDGFSDQDEITGGTDPNDNGSFPVATVDRPTPGSTHTTRDSVVVFNEIHYHPAVDGDDLEYIELYNQMSVDVDLSNWRIDGVDFDFPEGTVMSGKSYLIIAKDPGNYPGSLGPYGGVLSNSGETLRLYNNNRAFRTTEGAGSKGAVSDSLEGRRIMDEISYGDTCPWPLGPDGSGTTLAKIDPATGSAHPQNWTHGAVLNGTPGVANGQSFTPAIAFNEVGASTSDAFKLEIYNHGALPVALGDMVIVSSDSLQADYTFPAGNLAAGDFVTVDATTLGFTPDDNDRLFLFTAGKAELIDTARVDDRLKGRSPDGTGRWFNPDSATFGSANSFTFQSAIVINEIFYNAYPIRSTPGTPPTYTNVQVMDYDHVWRYNLDGGAEGLAAGWAETAHSVDDISWAQGPGLLGFETSELDEPILTRVTRESKITYYFETEFTYNDPAAVDQIILDHYLDDGAVFYLNGEEIARFNMDDGPVTPATRGNTVGNASEETLIVSNPMILQGSNRLSVEVHQSAPASSDLIVGIRASLRKFETSGIPPTPYIERDEEWLELYNRSDTAIDLSGWEIDGGIGYEFPDGTMMDSGGYLVVAKDAISLARKYPGIPIVGDYSGKLGNGGDQLVLEDSQGNPADEVTYFDRGKWHGKADGGGSSLELVDPDAENKAASSWAPSDESSRNTWNTYDYEDVAVSDGIGNNAYHEFLIALLDAGEFLLDDVSVVENGNTEMIQNGDFESDTPGATADKWRALGTHGSHGQTVVIEDPDSPGNQCLHVIATGPTGDKHNKLETTFANRERVTAGATYRIRFRAKFLSGSNQVNTRLYFNFLQRTTDISTAEFWGTPGSINSTALDNAGPALEALTHAPIVPDANQMVNVAIDATDPDDINDLTLFYSVNGGAFQNSPMAAEPDGNRYVGAIPGQAASRIVRFYIRARDSSNATTFYPAAGPDGGAFYKVQDGLADISGERGNFRIVMSESDRSFLFRSTNRMSNDRFPVTVIEDEEKVYYDVGLRLKASGFGRFNSGHYGFNIRFQPDHLFRGVHKSVSVERSPNLKEILAKHLMNRAGGGYWSFYDDVAHIITPTTGDRGVGLLSMSRQTSTFFDGLFPDAEESGTLFNHELLYSPNGTSGGPEGFKIGNPYNHTNGRYDLEDRGVGKEPYRWGFQIRSARGRDDYSQLIALNQAMELNGPELKEALDDIIDVDQWMRTFAMMSLNGTDDIYSRIWEHNFRYFVRPTDGKIIVFQWDLDRSFQLSATSSIPPSRNNVRKMFSIPEYRRIFDGHLQNLIETTFNSDYVSSWASHFTSLTRDNLNGLTGYVTSRANHIGSRLPNEVTFSITTNGGSDFSQDDSAVDLAGKGWIDVFSVTVNDVPAKLTWVDEDSWRMTVPISVGPNLIQLKAFNYQGVEVGADQITVTSTSTIELASAENIVIRELHYNPDDASAEEIAGGFDDSDFFEFIEILNINEVASVDMSGAAFVDGIGFTFVPGSILKAGERVVLVSNQAAFELRYGSQTATIAGEYSGQLSNSGEHIRFEAVDTTTIADFTYGDGNPWPASADGVGYSLVYFGSDPTHPLHWRTSVVSGGTPGGDDRQSFEGTGEQIVSYALASSLRTSLTGSDYAFSFLKNLNADDAIVVVEYSTDLESWAPLTMSDIASRINQGDGTTLVTYSSLLPPSFTRRQFVRMRVMAR